MKKASSAYSRIILFAVVIGILAFNALVVVLIYMQRQHDHAAIDSLNFYDSQQFEVIGRFHNEKNYHRFPQKYKNILRSKVWEKGLNSAGIGIRFRTNATRIAVRWSMKDVDPLSKEEAASGPDGIDLYSNSGTGWQYVNTGLSVRKVSEDVLLRRGDGAYREYLLNLPLYNGVESLSIGVDETADISKPKEKYLTEKKPVIYYGSSIVQGGAASRPGMTYTNILSRKLDRPFINFGFSGEGKFELSVALAMSEVDASLYVIDCNPNTPAEMIYDGALQIVRFLKKKRPQTPILLVEEFFYEDSFFNNEADSKRKELKRAFDLLERSGVPGLYYKRGDGLIGYDHEGTADGVLPNDLGMERFSEQMLPVIRSIIEERSNKMPAEAK